MITFFITSWLYYSLIIAFLLDTWLYYDPYRNSLHASINIIFSKDTGLKMMADVVKETSSKRFHEKKNEDNN